MKTPINFPVLAAAISLAFALPHSVAAQTYYDMTIGDYSQSFTGWTSYAVNWNGLPANSTGSIPSATRITAASTNIIAPSSSGGVQSTNTSTNLQFLSTGSPANTSSTGADLNLNFSGRNAGTVSFAAAQVSNSSGDRVGTLQLYYTTNGTAWTEITGTGLPFTATNNVARSANISVSLPAALNGQSTVKLRFYYYNGPSNGTTGSRPKISIDDLLVTSTTAVAGAPVITSGTTASAVAYEANANIYQITASNSPDSYAATGLPAGLSLNTSTGVISGTATVPGTYSVAITASNSQGTGGASLTLTVAKNPGAPTISSSLTSTGLVGSAYSYQIVADNSPTSYGAATLPAGLTVDSSTGLISGTPTSGGTFNISISASNALGSDTKTLALTLNSPPVITSPLSGSLYQTNSFAYTITADFLPSFYGATNLPSGWGINVLSGAISNGTTPLVTGSNVFQISAVNAFGTDTETYSLTVYDQASQNAVPLNVVVNKYVNGTPDKVQLLVVGDGTPGSTVDMRGMIIKDFSSNMANDGGGKFIFADNALWSAVPAGTFVTLSAGTTQTEDTDASDFYLAVNLGNATYFTNGGGSFDIATTDMLLLKSAGSGVSGVAGGIHALAGGTAGAQFTAYAGAKLRTTGTSGTDFGVMALNSTSQLSNYGASGQPESTDAQGGQAAASLNFASWNNGSNGNYVKFLRGIVDGTGAASIANGSASSPFFGQNVFARGSTGQTFIITYTPASTSANITAVTVSVPAALGAPVAGNVGVSGVGTAGNSVSVTDQLVTISGLNALSPNPVTISISGLATPDTSASVTESGRYTFTMQSQGAGGSLEALGASPVAVVTIPIANARNANPTTFVPLLANQVVAVEGAASVGRLGSGTLSSALQEGTNGITIFSSSTNVSTLPIRGNLYVVSGAVTQFNGLVQLNITNSSLIFDFGATDDPAPVTVSVPQLNASTGATNGINLQSRVVRIENLSYVSGTWGPNQNVILRDGSSNQVTVRIQSASTAGQPSYPVTLTGIAGQFDATSPFDTGFQIQPRDQDDAPALPPLIISSLSANATEGQPFSYQIVASDNPPATSYDAEPLPPGLSINAASGIISGTPTVSGTFEIDISATNGGGTTTASLTLNIQAGQTFTNWSGGLPVSQSLLLKYAIGGASSPTATNGVAPTSEVTSSNLSITAIVRTNDPNLSVVGQALTDLAIGPWTTNNVTMQPGDQTGVGEGLQRQIWTTPRNSDSKKFLRLQSTLTNQ